jgi:hypothetical protein
VCVALYVAFRLERDNAYWQALMLAITRASEICVGIVCAGVVLAGSSPAGSRQLGR